MVKPAVAIDGETQIPQDLFAELLRAATKTKSGGQHFIEQDKKGRQVLKHSDLRPKPRSRSSTKSAIDLKMSTTPSSQSASSNVSKSLSGGSTTSTSSKLSALASSGAEMMRNAILGKTRSSSRGAGSMVVRCQ